MAWTNYIYDSEGKFFGSNDNSVEAANVAASIGGRVEIVGIEDDYEDEGNHDESHDGCPYCGSYEGDWQECPECGHGQ